METENQKLRKRVEELSRETMLLAHTVTDLTAKLKLATAAAPQLVDAAQAVPEWISVEDVHKPDLGQMVLMHVRTLMRGDAGDFVEICGEGSEIALGEYMAGLTTEDENYFSCYTSPMSDSDWITHWMPLPAAPTLAANRHHERGVMARCKRCQWTAIPGTERDWPIKGQNGARIIRYDRYQEYKCAICADKKFAKAKDAP